MHTLSFRFYLALHVICEFKMIGVHEVLDLTTSGNFPLPYVILCIELKYVHLFCPPFLCNLLFPIATNKHFHIVPSNIHMTSLWLMITIISNIPTC